MTSRLRALALAPIAALALIGCSSTTATTSPAAAGTTSATVSPSASASAAAKTYTMADVATHKSATDCWAAVNQKVYDLTGWIAKHPGGEDKIIPLCGTDASSAFTTKHGSAQKPNDMLATFLIGDLAS